MTLTLSFFASILDSNFSSLFLSFPVCRMKVWIKGYGLVFVSLRHGEDVNSWSYLSSIWPADWLGPGIHLLCFMGTRSPIPELELAACHTTSSHFFFPPGTHAVAAKASSAATQRPRPGEQERKKRGLASSLRMEPHSHSGKSRKSTKFRSISRSLILCNAKTSDDGSSPDEKYPNPFETSLYQGKEGFLHSSMQLADTSEAGLSNIPDLALASGAAQLQEAGTDRGQHCRKMFFMKVWPKSASLTGPIALMP